MASLGRRHDNEQPIDVDGPAENVAVRVEEDDEQEIRRLGRLILLSLIGFLMAGWFLSRAFAMALFVLGGIAEVIYGMALQRGMVAPRMKLVRVFALSGVLAVTLVIVMYIVVRILNAVR